MNSTIVPLPNGDFTTEEYLNSNSYIETVVHTFSMGDVEDPDIYAAEPLLKWEESEIGQWIMQRALETPIWHRTIDDIRLGYKYKITARLSERDYTFWALRWGMPK